MAELLANPSLDENVSGWTAGANTAIAHDTSIVHAGAGSMKLTASATGNLAATSRVTTSPGVVYSISAYVRHASVSRSMGIQIDWRDSSGTYLSSSTASAGPSTLTYELRSVASVTAPASAVQADIKLFVNTATAGEVFYLDTASFTDPTGPLSGFYFASGGVYVAATVTF